MTPEAGPPSAGLADLVGERRVLLCCGTGGVGKTTTAAALAVEGARRGRNAVVLTIDPAKRLANALGIAHLSNTPMEIPRARWDHDATAVNGGRLHALMLDTKSTFDHLVEKHAADPEQAKRILDNTFYRNIAGALSGTQEYMAMEKLFELHDEGGYDLIVVDTPPTRHALDFLEAPGRLTRLLDNRIFRVLMMPTRATLRVTGFAAQAFLRTVARIVGSEVIDDIVAFFRGFEGMEQGFRDRAGDVGRLLGDASTSFVLVTTPRRDAVEEAEFFAARLAAGPRAVDALVVNRVHPEFSSARPESLRARAAALGARSAAADEERALAIARLAARYANLADFEEVAAKERRELAGLQNRIGHAAVVHVPELDHDVHDFVALRVVGRHLVGAIGPPTTLPPR